MIKYTQENIDVEGEKLQNLLEKLYIINKTAKDYKSGLEDTKDVGFMNNQMKDEKKEALYRLKTDILQEIEPKAVKIEIHIINSKEYYCLYFKGDWSFHIPKNEIDIEKTKIENKIEIKNFQSGNKKTRTQKSLRDSLEYFRDEFGINANNYIERTYTSGKNQYMIGWPYLA